jgi:hypothetical protein
MTVQVSLYESAQSQPFDVNGNGIAYIGPQSGREVWSPQNVHVSATTGLPVVNEASCTINVGIPTAVNPASFRDESFSGSSGDSTDKVSSDIVKCGTYVIAVWKGGDPGAIGTMNVTGTKTV